MICPPCNRQAAAHDQPGLLPATLVLGGGLRRPRARLRAERRAHGRLDQGHRTVLARRDRLRPPAAIAPRFVPRVQRAVLVAASAYANLAFRGWHLWLWMAWHARDSPASCYQRPMHEGCGAAFEPTWPRVRLSLELRPLSLGIHHAAWCARDAPHVARLPTRPH